MKKSNVKKEELEKTFSKMVKIIRDLPDDPYCIEQVERDLAFFAFGDMFLCDDGHILVGFHLDVPAEIISEFAFSLAEYKSLLIFETIPVFISDEKLDAGEEHCFEDEEAFIEFGKSLIAANCCSDCANELFQDEKNNKNKLLN